MDECSFDLLKYFIETDDVNNIFGWALFKTKKNARMGRKGCDEEIGRKFEYEIQVFSSVYL